MVSSPTKKEMESVRKTICHKKSFKLSNFAYHFVSQHANVNYDFSRFCIEIFVTDEIGNVKVNSVQEALHQMQTMTEAAIFTIGQSRTFSYGKIRPSADYRSRSRLLNLKKYI